MKRAFLFLSMFLLLFSLVACSSTTSEPAEQLVIAVLSNHLSSDGGIANFQVTHPAVDLMTVEYYPLLEKYLAEGIPYPDAFELAMAELLATENPPDVLIAPSFDQQLLIENEILLPLDGLIKRDQFDLGRFHPTILESLQHLGNGTLFGLASTYESSALAYNKKIFDRYQIPYPQDFRTWEQFVDLALQVTHPEDGIYGMDLSLFRRQDVSEYHFFLDFIKPLQVDFIDPHANQMSINNATWRQVFADAIHILNSGALIPYVNTHYDHSQSNQEKEQQDFPPFLSGRVAMMEISSTDLGILTPSSTSLIQYDEWVDFDLVTVPVHPDCPGIGATIYFPEFYTIYGESPRTELAWEFIQFALEHPPKDRYSQLHAFQDATIHFNQDLHWDAFHLLSPPAPSHRHEEKALQTKRYEIHDVIEKYFTQMLDNEISIDEAIVKIELEGQAILDRLNLD